MIDIENQYFLENQHFVETKNNNKCVFILLCFTMLILFTMERNLYCQEFDYALWNSYDEHLSQHLFDVYSITHALHGVIVYNVLSFYKINIMYNKYITIIFACLWEIIENTDFVIDIYRKEAIHNGYYGDSITNSFGDILSCVFGWYIAKNIGMYCSILLFLGTEYLLYIYINDNLTNNIITLFNIPQLTITVIMFYIEFKIKNIIGNVLEKIKVLFKRCINKLQ